MSRILISLFACGLAIYGSTYAARADPDVIQVSLSDAGPDTQLAKGLGMGMKGADMSMAAVKIEASPSKVKAGKVRLEVSNGSKAMVHEMVIAKADPDSALPYDSADSKVDEGSVASLGEVAELDPGKSGTLDVVLEPGTYVLFCNVPGHYDSGMWSLIEAR